jgi:triphosphoribosyl-dephospho-CoA synthase
MGIISDIQVDQVQPEWSTSQRLDRSNLFQRHDWVWVYPSQLDVSSLPWAQREEALAWASFHPLVVTRRSPQDIADETLRLGFCVPNPNKDKPHRFALSCKETDVRVHRPALLLKETQHTLRDDLPPLWNQLLNNILYLQARFDFQVRVYGSLAWQAIHDSQLDFIRQGSDLDLLIIPPKNASEETLRLFMQKLQSLSDQSELQGGPGIDGELRLGRFGDISWKEWLLASESKQIRVLSKLSGSVKLVSLPSKSSQDEYCRYHPDQLDAWAIAALKAEAMAWPKPGLVSPVDQGSHEDMDIQLLLKAIESLRSWFGEFARAAQSGAEFKDLVAIGRAAEAVMMQATQGVNVYRGAIFNLGLLVASAAVSSEARDVPAFVAQQWGEAIRAHQRPASYHGAQLRTRYGSGGALQEAANGFPILTQFALPAFFQAQRKDLGEERALIASLMASIEHLEDTNLIWRGGLKGLTWAKQKAEEWNQRENLSRLDWRTPLVSMHDQFVEQRLSPGGSADMAACAHFLWRLTQQP